MHKQGFILISNVISVIKLVSVNPGTSATAEGTLSLAKNMKTWLQSTMLPARFNYLALLKLHKKWSDKLNLLNVVNNLFARRIDKNYLGVSLIRTCNFTF